MFQELMDNDIEEEPLPWALSVKREVYMSTPQKCIYNSMEL